MKRFFLFFLVNILVITSLSIVWFVINQFYPLGYHLGKTGFNYTSLLIFCLIWGMGGGVISLLMSKIVAKSFYGVKIIDEKAPRQLQDIVQITHEMARRAGLSKMPEVGYYDSPEVNAFATGPSSSNSLVAVSSGLLNKMSRDEIEGVIGHEITHIANGDMVTMTLIQGVVNAFVMFFARIVASLLLRRGNDEGGGGFAYFGLVMLLQVVFSFFGMMAVAAFSRAREFRADAGGARYAGRGKMIMALNALRRNYESQRGYQESGQEAVASLKISGGGMMALLSTHPPLEDRIKRLQDGL